jgi:uncharacterized protein (DUF4415 family)
MKKEKDFSNNPAMAFMSNLTETENSEKVTEKAQEPKEKKASKAKAPKKEIYEPVKKETKSKSILLRIKPTVLEKLQERAKEYSISTSELIAQILEANI